MCHLLTDSSPEVQKMTHQFLQEAAKKRTEWVVIEAAVDTAGTVKADLPLEVVDLLSRTFDDSDELESGGQVNF
jgi:E3 ubiquitin-protein ligase listerin